MLMPCAGCSVAEVKCRLLPRDLAVPANVKTHYQTVYMASTSVKQICSSKRSVNSDRISAYRTKQFSLLFQVTLRGTVNVCTYWERSDKYSRSLYRSTVLEHSHHTVVWRSLNKGRPAWWHLLYYVSLLLKMFRMLIHPSSGACDYLVRYCVGCIVLTWGVFGVM